MYLRPSLTDNKVFTLILSYRIAELMLTEIKLEKHSLSAS